jgi:hypothetical protein
VSKKSKRNKATRPAGAIRNSARITTGEGAKPYDESTLALLRRLVPGAEIVHPLGIADETDKDRLARARAMAGHHRRAFAAVVRVEAMTTLYWQELVLGSAHELHIMRSKVQHVEAAQPCPYGTVVVLFKAGHKDRIENGLCPIYWERN